MKYLYAFSCLIYFHTTFAFFPNNNTLPNDIIVSGKVADSLNQQPIEFASVSILNTQKQMIGGAMTDSEGNFRISIKENESLTFVFSFVGYRNKSISRKVLKNADSNLSLGIILLQPETKILEEVKVTAQAALIEDKPDRLVYNADKDISNKGGTAEDILKKVPLLTLDIDGNIQMRGSGNIKVLINNKPSSILAGNIADALKQIPAEMIKQVEVITAPSAKYDAEGTAGIINVITKKNTLQGITGGVNLGIGVRGSGTHSRISFKQKKYNISWNMGGNSSYNSPYNSYLLRNNNYRGQSTTLIQDETGINNRINGNSNLNFDYDFNAKNSLSTNIRFGIGDSYASRNQESRLSNSLDSTLNAFKQIIKNDRINRSIDLDANYTRTFTKEGKEFSILIQHGRNIQDNNFNTNRENLPFNASNNHGLNQETTLQSDFSYPFEKNTLELGSKMIIREVGSTFDFYRYNATSESLIQDESRTNDFNYRQIIFANYVSALFNFSHKWGLKLGLRYENTQIRANFQNDKTPLIIAPYQNLIPAITVSKEITKNHKVRFNYNQRIQRPSLEYLNPFVNYLDPLNISKGNPLLVPELSHSFEMNYNTYFKSNSFNFSLFRRFTNNGISTVRNIGESGVITSSFENIGQSNFYGTSFYIHLQPTQKFRIGGGVNLVNSLLTGNIILPILQENQYLNTIVTLRNSGWNKNFNFNTSFTFDKGWAVQGFGYMGSPQIQLQGYAGAYRYYNLGLKKEFAKKKATINVGIDNPFSKTLTIVNQTSDPSFTSNYTRNVYNRGLRFIFNYNFGKMNFTDEKNSKNRKKVNNDDSKSSDS